MMLKKKSFAILLTFLLTLSLAVNSFAAGYQQAKQESDEIAGSTDVLGRALEGVTEIDSSVLARVSDIANVEVKKDGKSTQYIFTTKEPISQRLARDGRTESDYHIITYAYYPSSDESVSSTPQNNDLLIKGEMFYKKIQFDSVNEGSKVTKSSATILRFNETGLSNLKINIVCVGERLDDQFNSYAYGREESTYGNASPQVGMIYSGSPNFTYYYHTNQYGQITTKISADYYHGSSKYTANVNLNYGTLLGR